jgi:hypothetical protein
VDREAAARMLAEVRRRFPKLSTEELGTWLAPLEALHEHDVTLALERIMLESNFTPTLALVLDHARRAGRDRDEHEAAAERRAEARDDERHATERQEIARANLRRAARLLAEPQGSETHEAILRELEANVDARTSHYGRELEEGERERLAAPLGLGAPVARSGRGLVRLGD